MNFDSKNASMEDDIEKLIEEYKKDFVGLTPEQKKLLAYRKIIELRKNNYSFIEISKKLNSKNVTDEQYLMDTNFMSDGFKHLKAIVKASDENCSLLSALLLYENDREEYRKIYHDSLVCYYKILENYKQLAKELKLENALCISNLFVYMLWNGYYSVTKEHNYKLQSRLLLPSMQSFDVIKGQGVCLAYAELLHNYLTVCGYKSAILNCKVSTKKKDMISYYRPEIVRKHNNNTYSKILSKTLQTVFNSLINHTGNHAVTLIEDANKKFIYDPTNLYVLQVMNDKTASLINGQGKYDIKPYSSLWANPNCDPFQLFEELASFKLSDSISFMEVVRSFENTFEVIKQNINLLDDAYDNIHSELEFINRQTDELGGRYKVKKMMKSKD